MDDRIVIIDGNSLVNRAYFAIQKPMITKDGLYTQGIYGFLSMLKKIRSEYEPTHMLVAFDRKAPTFRHKEYDAYKAGRKKMPLELAMEMPVLKEVLSAMGIHMFEIDGFEADDIIGTTARMAEEADIPAFVITGDKDALQLATDKTSVIITKKGISEFKLYDDAAMIEEYGFDHKQFIDYKGLRGDTSDNIPGIPGVGEKTATALIQQFGSIENMLQHTDEISSAKLREKVEDGAMSAMISKRLATIVTNVPVDYSVEDCRIKETDTARLTELYKKLEFRKFLEELLKDAPKGAVLLSSQPDTLTVSKEAEKITDSMSAYMILNDAVSCGHVIIDIDSDLSHTAEPSLDKLYISFNDKSYEITSETDLKAVVIPAFSGRSCGFTGYDLSRVYYVLLACGCDITKIYTEFDCALAQYVLSSSSKTEEKIDFGFIQSLCSSQKAQIEEQGLSKVLYEIEFPLCKVLANMEYDGIHVDKDVLTKFGTLLEQGLKESEELIYALAGEKFNINSPMQLGNILFDKLGLPSGKKTKKGYSTSAEILEKLAPDHPIVASVLEYRMLSKLNSTYVEGLIPLIDKSGRIHAHFRQTVTATGRISCTEPNLQNIPVRNELGRELRKAFYAGDDDHVLIGADYSQIELRVLAHMSSDPTLIKAFNDGLDIHRETASKVFGVPEDQVTSQMRSNAKAVNFGVIYGMSGFGLSNELTISRKQAEKYIQDYFERFPGVKAFMDGCVASCRKEGSVRTLYGRKRTIPEISASQYMVRQLGERLAMNTPIQGTAADIIKFAMIKVSEELADKCPDARLILQIHDELIIRAPKKDEKLVGQILTECMENAAKLAVKLDISLNQGENWYMLK